MNSSLLFTRNAKKAYADQSILQAFLLSQKKRLTNLKSSSCKKVFPKCLSLIQLASMIFIPCNNWKQYFLHKFIATQRLGAIAMLLRSLKQRHLWLCLKQVFWKNSKCYVRYLHNNFTMMRIPKFQIKLLLLKSSQKKITCWPCFYLHWKKFTCWPCFYLHSKKIYLLTVFLFTLTFCKCSTYYVIRKFLKLKSSWRHVWLICNQAFMTFLFSQTEKW